MLEVEPGHWVISCKLCRRTKHHFDTARECHNWWRSHEVLESHLEAVKRGPWPWSDDDRKLCMAIYGTTHPRQQRR